MSVDYYGSYTNNDLIYEAITGQTRDPTEGPNKFTPLNTPIISASIAEKYAIINLVGVCLRFVSLDNGVTTPAYFNIPSSKLYTIKNNLIWDIYLDGFVADEVGALPNIIVFSNHDDNVVYFIRNENTNNLYMSYSTNSTFISCLKMCNTYADRYYYTDVILTDKFETGNFDRLSFLCILRDNTNTSITPKLIDYVNFDYYKCDFLSVYNQKCYLFINSMVLYIVGTFNYFDPVTGATNSAGTATYSYNERRSNLFNSYNISKAWLYGEAIIAVTTNNLVLVVGDNRNGRLTPDNENDFITSPYILDVGNPYEFVIDKGLTSGESYYILYDALTESGNKLNIRQSTYSNNLIINNLTQIQNEVQSLGKVITQSDFHTKTAITLPGSNEVIWFRWDVQIPENTGNEESVNVTLGPYIEWDYDPDLI